ncbi:MAG: hypothetical protein J0H74_18355 [Chitinophagaceae bacterium]|nr:hypothetical protein [Chitinophagaceae bacterium]
MPPFQFTDLINYAGMRIDNASFKGRWKVIYCFNKECSSCVASFLRWENLRKEFSDSIEIILLGYTGSAFSPFQGPASAKIKNLMRSAVAKLNLGFPCAFDSVFFEKFGRLSPYTLVIDPGNVVRAVTGDELYAEDISGFLQGHEPKLERIQTFKERIAFKVEEPFLIDNNGGRQADYLYRSVLTKWNDSVKAYRYTLKQSLLQITGADLKTLYRIAYTGYQRFAPSDSVYGHIFPYPLVELSDDHGLLKEAAGRKYNYSLSLPENQGKKEGLLNYMRKDLDNYFGSHVVVERRRMPYWKVTLDTGKNSIKTVPYETYRSYWLDALLFQLSEYDKDGLYFINESGLEDRGCIELPAFYSYTRKTDLFTIMINAGFKIEKSEKEMAVIVVRDKVL